MQKDKPDKQPDESSKPTTGPAKPSEEPVDPIDLSSLEASFWEPSQIQAVVRHAGATGRSPEEFFNKKWKDRHIHGKKDEAGPQQSDGNDGGDDHSRSSQA